MNCFHAISSQTFNRSKKLALFSFLFWALPPVFCGFFSNRRFDQRQKKYTNTPDIDV